MLAALLAAHQRGRLPGTEKAQAGDDAGGDLARAVHPVLERHARAALREEQHEQGDPDRTANLDVPRGARGVKDVSVSHGATLTHPSDVAAVTVILDGVAPQHGGTFQVAQAVAFDFRIAEIPVTFTCDQNLPNENSVGDIDLTLRHTEEIASSEAARPTWLPTA